jgi:toxin ParE1/3/4
VGQTRSVRLHYTLPALADLSAILDYIAAHSPQGVWRVQARIQALTGLLLQHPHIGRRTSDPAIRRMATTPYPYLASTRSRRPRSSSTPSVTQPAIRPECPALLERVMTEPFYAPHQLAELQEGYYAVNRTYEQLLGEYLSLRLTSEAAYEYARHGFVRRLGTLKRCTGTSTGRPMIAVLAASPT